MMHINSVKLNKCAILKLDSVKISDEFLYTVFSYILCYSLVKAMVFPVVMYGCENWTIKKAEH